MYEQVSISDIADVVTGKTPSTKDSRLWEPDIPFITPKDLQATKHIATTDRRVSNAVKDRCSKQVVPAGSVCVSCIGNLGYVGVTEVTSLTNQQINTIVPNDPYDSDYLYYVMRWLWPYFKHLEGQSTTLSIINKSQFKRTSIPWPNQRLRQRISDILNCFDDMIELNLRTNDYLLQLMEHFYREMFAYRDQKYGSIYDIADVVYGAPFKSSLFNEDGDGWPLIRIRDLSTYQPQYYTSEEHPKRTFIEPGDVVAGMDADFSPTLWLGKRAVLNQRVCEFVPPRGTAVTKSYLLCATRPLLSFIQGYATGTTVAHLGKGDLEALRVPLPREDDLLAFGNICEPMRLMIVSNSEESARLSMIRDTLLPKLMSGEIDVSKVELPTPPNNHLGDY